MSDIKFHCSSCQICCTKVGNAVKEARMLLSQNKGQGDARTKAVAAFPYKTDEKEACSMLENGQCKVYETRPDVCNVEKSFELFANGRTKEQYFSDNGKICNQWIRKEGLGFEYLVTENY